MKVKNLDIIGTSHIARESVEAISKYIKTKKPEIVALELDERRAHALLHSSKSRLSIKLIKVIGVKGFLFLVIASFLQKKLGRVVGVEPGSEMKTALKAAMKENAKVALIDRNLEITMRRLSETLSWKERLRFIADILTAPFSTEMKEFRNIDLRKVPSKNLIVKILKRLKNRYPNLYKVLVEERNEHMASSLADIMKKHPDSSILAVVGAGHEEDLAERVREKLKKGVTYSFSFG